MEELIAKSETKVRLEAILDPLLERVPESSRFDRVLVRGDFVGVRTTCQVNISSAAKTVEGPEIVVAEAERT